MDNVVLERSAPMRDGSVARALVVANRRSRRGENAGALFDALRQHGIDPVSLDTTCRTEVTPAILAAANGVEMVVAAGGDGTVNSVAEGVMRTGLPLGIVPMGTANDLARTLHLPTDLARAVAVIGARRTKAIDVGEVNGHPFFNVASVGLSADLAESLTAERKRRFGRLAYVLTALRVLAFARPFGAEIVTREGATRVRTLQVAVGNGRYYGGGMAVEADARIDDGTLDLYSLEFQRLWKLLLVARDFRRGAQGAWREVRTERCVAFEVRTRKPRPINTDGELITFTPARFEIRPKAVRVFIP